MATYYCDFSNQTSRTWTMCVYQTLPDSIGLESVSWKQTTVPMQGHSGVSWEETYNVVIANYVQVGGKGVYKASQTLDAELGTAWDIVFKDNVQQLVRNGTTAPGQLLINNRSGFLANPGMGMSNQGAVYKPETLGGSSAQFNVKPTFWVGLFNSLELGEVISSNVIVGPFQLTYADGKNMATLTATEFDGVIKVDITYSQAMAFSLESVQQKLEHLEQRKRSLRAA